MNRSLVLTASLYNAGVLSVLNFIVQCSEMFKDDVFSWGDGVKYKTPERFKKYADKFGRFGYKLFRDIRNIYVHEFDTDVDRLYVAVAQLTLLDIKNACNYFGVSFDSGVILESLRLTCVLLEHMRNLEELNGCKES